MDRNRHKIKASEARKKRLKLNCLNLIFTCIVLVVTVKIADGSFTSRINKISENLNKALDDALELDNVTYTDITDSSVYHSSTQFWHKGMGGLYNITNAFMNLLITKDNIYPEGVIIVEGSSLRLGSIQEQWKTLVSHYAALLAVLIVLIIFAVLMPLCGLCFCCCRCCGKCGARSKPFDKKSDFCKKFFLATLLICVGTLMLFGVVCSFVSNQNMQDGTNELVDNLKTNVKDSDTYLKSTEAQINILLKTNYREFESVLFGTLDNCSAIMVEQLGEYANAAALTEVVKIVNGLGDIRRNLTVMKIITNELRVNASQLNDALRKVKKDLLTTLQNCESRTECSKLANKYVSKLDTEIDFNGLPDISREIDDLNNVLNSNITSTVEKGKKAFENIRTEIDRTIKKKLPNIKTAVGNAGSEIRKGASNVTSVIKQAREYIHDHTNKPLKDMQMYIKEFSPYRYYLGLIVSCVLLLIALCVTLGLICGICGKRPDAYGDDCCNKGAGSRFLMIGVAVMFMFAIILAGVAIVHFLIGILSQRLVCDSLRYSNESQIIHLADEVVNLKQSIGVDVNISSVLSSCHRNQSIYNVLRLEKQFNVADIDSYLEKFNIEETLNELTKNVHAHTNVTLLSRQARDQLRDLVDSKIDEINYDRFTNELTHNLTSVDLSYLANELDNLVSVVQNNVSDSTDIVNQLKLSSLHLQTYQTRLVAPMKEGSEMLIEIAKALKESLSFGKGSFAEAIEALIKELEDAQNHLQIEGRDDIINIAKNFGHGIEKQIRGYLGRVRDKTINDVGRCGPVSLILNSTLTATCDKILLPWNGFWFSIMWCLVLFIPTIILSVKLATLYQKYEPYPGPLVEAEYLYDAYADRDNIPLNSVNNKKKKYKKKHKRYDGRGAYAAEAGGEHGIPRDVPSGSHFQDARYADMAPKHWEEFPAGGPPQYQRAPTEYERPPPYYYPGTDQQQ